MVQIEYWETDTWKVHGFNFLNEEVEEFSNRWSPSLINVKSPSYLKQKTFQYCLWGIDYILSFSFWHGNRVWINFSIVIREKKWSVKCSWSLRELRFPSPQQVQGRAMLGDQKNSILTAQKTIDWLIIYTFFTSNLVLPEEFLYKFELVIMIRDFLVSWKTFICETLNLTC